MTQKPKPEAGNVWEQWTEGELDREEQAFLRALADEDTEEGYKAALHAPLDTAFRARVTDLLGDRIDAEKLQKRRLQRRRMLGASSALLAAAAAILLWWPNQAELPEYRLSMQGGIRSERSAAPLDPSAIMQLWSGSVVDLTFQPATPVSGQAELYAWRAEGTTIVPLAPRIERAEGGAFRIHGRADQVLGLAPGRHTLLFMVAREEPALDAVRQALTKGSSDLMRVEVEFTNQDPSAP